MQQISLKNFLAALRTVLLATLHLRVSGTRGEFRKKVTSALVQVSNARKIPRPEIQHSRIWDSCLEFKVQTIAQRIPESLYCLQAKNVDLLLESSKPLPKCP